MAFFHVKSQASLERGMNREHEERRLFSQARLIVKVLVVSCHIYDPFIALFHLVCKGPFTQAIFVAILAAICMASCRRCIAF